MISKRFGSLVGVLLERFVIHQTYRIELEERESKKGESIFFMSLIFFLTFKVRVVRMASTKQVYAMKKLKKSEMISKDQVLHVRNERQLHADSNTIHGHNDWVVALYYSFQDPNYLYLIMEYVPGLFSFFFFFVCLFCFLHIFFLLFSHYFSSVGGDMMTLLIEYDTFSEEVTQFYIAQTICAIHSIHQLDYIHRFPSHFPSLLSHTFLISLSLCLFLDYRDIKPDNLLVDRHGHLKLADFGLCTGVESSRFAQMYKALKGKDFALQSSDYKEMSRMKKKETWKKKRRLEVFLWIALYC